jgi:hypothetical protein
MRCIDDGLRARSDSSAVGHSGGGGIGARGRQQLHYGLQGGWIGARGLQQLRSGPQDGRIDGGTWLGSRSPGARASICCGSGGVGLQGT